MANVPPNEVYWYAQRPVMAPPLSANITTDIVIIGGGMAGITAAQSFKNKGCNVVLLEKNFCGAGASGKSSGFITPDSELDLTYFVKTHGLQTAKKIWDFVTAGVRLIENNIKTYNIACDYQPQDTLIVANSSFAMRELEEEFENRKKLNYECTLYSDQTVQNVIGSPHYYGGISYGSTFGINCAAYLQHMKEMLMQSGVQIYEDTPALKIENDTVYTSHGSVQAKHIIVCADCFVPDLGLLQSEIYHAQTFLLLSHPLNNEEIRKIFPQKNYMVWDTDLIYTYYRVTGDNRLLLGGGSLLNTYSSHEIFNSEFIYNELTTYIQRKFPDVSLDFEFMWPGLIGITKDIVPIAGFDKNNKHIYYVAGAAGLPLAATLANCSAERIINGNTEFDKYFSPQRQFPIGAWTQKILGTQLSFALSNGITLFIKPWFR